MRTEIKKLHRTVATTVIYVTHDQVEAMTLADRIVVLKDGIIEQVGTPEEVYNHPRTIFVASFIGSPTMNFIPARLVREHGRLSMKLNGAVMLSIPDDRNERYLPFCDQDVILGLRPNLFSLEKQSSPDEGDNIICSEISVVEPLGSDTLFFFNLAQTEVVASLPPLQGFKAGDRLSLKIDMRKMHLFDPATEKMI
jgi:multiple sugar transport system ATP-binding protein